MIKAFFFHSVAGWGRLSERSPTAQTLRSVIVPVWSQDVCLKAGYGSTRITGNMMCGGYPEGQRDSCQGNNCKFSKYDYVSNLNFYSR
jgi:Trypsin